ncbi:acyl-CoA dehydrogenase family protein [Pseudonocardia lacus]|uniref:acyl-CoA dehydrogenase family protein n=1 Tax=Pseudonocardia lacus TaxID=2835865 RepID=UPI001BDCA9EC|nr:acyl-CoA dehydrogenase family protein [Pseudonocardia lacus]
MTHTLTVEQQDMRTSVRDFLADRSTTADVRRAMDLPDRFDPALWRALGTDLGLTGLAVPEEHGGLGLGHRELAVVLREMGAALLCAPYFSSSVLAVQALLAVGDAGARRDLLPGIADGSTIATVALPEQPAADWDLANVAMRAAPAGDGHRLTGTKLFVPDGQAATVLLVVARDGDDLALFAVEAAADGVTRTPLEVLDLTRPQSRVDLDGAAARRLGSGDATAALTRALRSSAIALAAEQVGAAERCVATSVAYAKQRVQFGRPIGSFQAVKHRIAEGHAAVEAAAAAVTHAAALADTHGDTDDDAGLPIAAHIAKASATDALSRVAADCVHVHGGFGFTWECDAQLYFKRAKSSAQLLGGAAHHRALLADHIGV